MSVFWFITAMVIGYVIGSFPSGVVVGRAAGVDVRQMGSGKTGATNVQRSAGWGAGAVVAVADILKGVLAVFLAQHVFAPSSHVDVTAAGWMAVLAGLCAVLGHNYSIFAGFKGGRGVATTGGMALALALVPALLTLPIFVLPILLTRYVSLGSIIGVTALPFMSLLIARLSHGALTTVDIANFLALLVAAAAIDFSHHDNIMRLRNGTERRLGEKAKPVATT